MSATIIEIRPLRCRHCQALVMEHYQTGAEYRFTCRRCRAAESSTGIIRGPDHRRFEGWQRSLRCAS